MASDAANALALLVGRNIRAARVEKGLNGRQLAEALKVLNPQRAPSAQRVSDWERGVQQPDSGYMKTLSETLERPVAWFYSEHEAETPGLSKVLPKPNVEAQLAALTRMVSELSAQLHDIQVAQGEATASAVEVMRLLADRLPPIQESQRRRQQ